MTCWICLPSSPSIAGRRVPHIAPFGGAFTPRERISALSPNAFRATPRLTVSSNASFSKGFPDMSLPWPPFWQHIRVEDRSALSDVLTELLAHGALIGDAGRGLELYM